ncbi:MAG: purine-nucleoside phosphorylase [Mycoplasma sp.]
MTFHLDFTKDDIAKKVIMPGDPLRAKYIAEKYLENPVCINRTRNILGYTGTYNGKKVSVIASGMGIPSMGIYSYELFKFYDVEEIIRIGTCGTINKDVKIGDVVIGKKIMSNSSYAKDFANLDLHEIVVDKKYLECIKSKKPNLKFVDIFCSENFYTLDGVTRNIKNADVVEMESFSLQANAFFLNRNAVTLLTVSDSLISKGNEFSKEERETKLNTMIELAFEIL